MLKAEDSLFRVIDRAVTFIRIALEQHDHLICVRDCHRYLLPDRKDGEARFLRIGCSKCNGKSNILTVFPDEASFDAAGLKVAKTSSCFFPQDDDGTEARVVGECLRCGSSLSATIIMWRIKLTADSREAER